MSVSVMQPARPRRKLNTAVLANIASRTAQKRLSNFAPASDVAGIYVSCHAKQLAVSPCGYSHLEGLGANYVVFCRLILGLND